MMVCLACRCAMLSLDEPMTAWVKQTKKEHPCTVFRCPRCGITVADVGDGRSERPAEEPWPGDLALDLPEDPR